MKENFKNAVELWASTEQKNKLEKRPLPQSWSSDLLEKVCCSLRDDGEVVRVTTGQFVHDTYTRTSRQEITGWDRHRLG